MKNKILTLLSLTIFACNNSAQTKNEQVATTGFSNAKHSRYVGSFTKLKQQERVVQLEFIAHSNNLQSMREIVHLQTVHILLPQK